MKAIDFRAPTGYHESRKPMRCTLVAKSNARENDLHVEHETSFMSWDTYMYMMYFK
jgi:hypothetical protein